MRVEEISSGVHRLTDGITNCYIVEGDHGVTLVDGFWPWDVDQVLEGLRRVGRSGADVRAVAVTHGHPDHFGAAERLRRTHGAEVRAHPREEDLLRGRRLPGSPLAVLVGAIQHLWRPFTWRFLLHGVRHGFVRPSWVRQIQPVVDGEPLDVPGRPTAVYTPGHTAGHTAYHLADRGIVFSGDALVTLNVATGSTTPQAGALGEDMTLAYRSLERLEGLDAEYVLPGHGEPWKGSPAAAVAQARALAPGRERAVNV